MGSDESTETNLIHFKWGSVCKVASFVSNSFQKNLLHEKKIFSKKLILILKNYTEQKIKNKKIKFSKRNIKIHFKKSVRTM